MCKRAGAYFYNVHPATAATCSWMGSRQDEQSRKRGVSNSARGDQRRRQKAWLQEGKCAVCAVAGQSKKPHSQPMRCRPVSQSVLLCAYKNTGEGSQVFLGTLGG